MSNYQKPRIRTDSYGDKWVDGEFYMGRNRIPPMPNRIAMTDRTTGEVKVLSHTPGAGSIDLVDRLPRWYDVTVYGPYEGPYSGNYRLYLSDGTLAFEYAEGYNSATILTRLNFDTSVIEITADSTGSVVYTPYSL